MCYDDQARPPVPPGPSGATSTEDLVLTASDGNRFSAFAAYPAQTGTAAVLIYPDVRGLHQFYKDLATRFAETGTAALALDYFGRTAGLTSRDEPFEFMPHVQQLGLDTFTLDVEAGLAYLRTRLGALPIFVVGFCMGGALTLQTGTNAALGFAGLLPFYPGLRRPFGGQGTALENAERICYPVRAFFGGADQGIPESDVQQLEEKLTAAGVDHELKIYPGAPHSFFDRRAADYAAESSDAWQRVLAFIAEWKEPAAR
ncbi:MAG TPA: dienelactone hydrolase family protein [Chloroflexia bacterium]|nr:dienelactone hydrolase family protein [Chloroflexia bacterium]